MGIASPQDPRRGLCPCIQPGALRFALKRVQRRSVIFWMGPWILPTLSNVLALCTSRRVPPPCVLNNDISHCINVIYLYNNTSVLASFLQHTCMDGTTPKDFYSRSWIFVNTRNANQCNGLTFANNRDVLAMYERNIKGPTKSMNFSSGKVQMYLFFSYSYSHGFYSFFFSTLIPSISEVLPAP